MTKEEILAKSRQENKDKDLYELEIDTKAEFVGAITAFSICLVLFASEIFICGKTNFGLWGMICSLNAGSYIYKGIKLKKTSVLVCGIICSISALLMVGYTIYKFFAVSTIL